ncbi:MAG: decaprenylphospho-beta-D-erythro-pentofuranosid-2-ulose 2-reductase [Solirubrobacteraceae bacterium]|jgi:decaprenylphospho-beta-D-erythro-pentofuranosid-2-ulose 2-reductase|nr:decaprenylphospho-beta-D-erythro-pentofuranosid-2-ulose 2-reductase [Solirubrobacteraceae bacterium]
MIAAAPRRVLVVGGSSDIALAITRRLAADGPVAPVLLGRDAERLAQAAATLARAGCEPPQTGLVEATDLDSHGAAVAAAFASSGGFDIVVVAVGIHGAQRGLDDTAEEMARVMRVNFLGAGSLLIHCLQALRAQGSGTLVVLSSVAAERPRRRNAVYGSTKAGLDALAQGLADASRGSGVRVLVVRPGFVATRMTAGLPRPPMATTPDAVAEATVRALAGRTHTVWVPGRLRWVFAVLRHLPRSAFRLIRL